MTRISGFYRRDRNFDAQRGDAGDASTRVEVGRATLFTTGDSNAEALVIDGQLLQRGGISTFVDTSEREGFYTAARTCVGDAVVVFYDERNETLHVSRDRFGTRPLYYVDHNDYFAFASQPRRLIGLPGVSSDLNDRFLAVAAAAHYRVLDNRPEESPYADIKQLPPGHLLEVTPARTTVRRYWDIEDAPEREGTEEELAEQYRDLLLEAVSARLALTRRPAFMLSGGMDSSSILASAVRAQGPQHAFSTVYEDATFDESIEIKPMLHDHVAEWHRVEVGDPDVFSLVEQMVAAHEEPVATATWLSHFLLCEHVREAGFDSLFGGLGGDELNAGEYEYFIYFFADLKHERANGVLSHEIDRWSKYHDHPIYKKDRNRADEQIRRLVDLSQAGRVLPDLGRIRRYSNALNKDFFDLDSFIPEMDRPFDSYLKNRTYQDIYRETMPCCLRAEDRHSNYFGLEHFDPFLDHRLVDFMFRVGNTYKIRDGVTKRLLRTAMKGVLPEETRTRVKKTGWNAPAHVWFTGRSAEPLRDLIASSAFRQRGIYNPAEVERLYDEHQEIVRTGEERENHMMFFWQLLNVELWLRSLTEAGTDGK